ncbi:MAG: glutamate formimidoyltransferase [Planctomycetota bacterium]|nr:glutamate formimidoyltransferase [Planctomycetota bacterium]
MSDRIILCEPNFSEGRDRGIIGAIASEIRSVPGVTLIEMEADADINRTVATFAGPPEAVVEAAFRATRRAVKLIDMSVHHGAHQRQGAADVCPLVPIAGVSLAECAEYARGLGARVGGELGIPVYMYGEAALIPQRRDLRRVRRGEYEALPEKLGKPEWKPDYGPARFDPKAGAIAIGAREFLVAFNVNLDTSDPSHAEAIAGKIRTSGAVLKDGSGKPLRDSRGRKLREPGMFQSCRATAWMLERFKVAQVAVAISDYNVTPMHAVFDAVCELARERGVRVTGAEVIGMIPKAVLVQAGIHYRRKSGRSSGLPEMELIRVAAASMGLDDISRFDPARKVLEFAIGRKPEIKDLLTLAEFADRLSMDESSPGGGSASTFSAAMAAALSALCCNFSMGRGSLGGQMKNGEADILSECAVNSQKLKDAFLDMLQEESAVERKEMDAEAMPEKTAEQKAARRQAMLAAAREGLRISAAKLERLLRLLALIRKAVACASAGAAVEAIEAAELAFAAARATASRAASRLRLARDPKTVAYGESDIASQMDHAKKLLEEIRELAWRTAGSPPESSR